MNLLRRAFTVPLMTIVMATLLVAGPLLLAGAGITGLFTRSTRPARTVAVLMAYALIELRTLAKLLGGNRDCDRLMRNVLTSVYAAVRRFLDVEVVLDPASVKADAIPRDEPIIVLSRHCGPGDSVLVAWLLAMEYGLHVRIVLKSALRCDPVLDVAGELGCLCFLDRGDRAREQIRGLAGSLDGGQAMLLFPEGANFSWPRWRDAVSQLHWTRGFRAARRALRQSHTLPPRSGGAAAAVAGAPSASILVVTHNGFCADGRDRPWWQLPIHRRLLIRTALIPAARIPPPARIGPWLERTWTQVDAWVAAHAECS
ncbi:1-acyl-sn-glycerol-3-phosphate acyltransferase [Mycobacterium sp. Marseille-P9652]|uniref:1-acyl-sn-glycerol-3-phosphate acyltransferase n=1 Tax=Mycobacterium sp. Marseille-P9652 TaxID=2654950 RepID=UPI0012E8CAAD|nr:1-acyl-sn-glycerol-3-phosphate acyltransferase [Mycobacterium sp. Marseille-P9652]